MRRRHRLLLLVAALLLSGGLGVYLWIFADLPPLEAIDQGKQLPSTRIYDRNGTLLYQIARPEAGRNTVVPLAAIPPRCVQAVIATEDANYWSHPGVDIEGILRALWLNLRGGEVVAGGSTITQQTARLLLLDAHQQAERSLTRKLKEMVLAIRLQNASSKEAVLELYLNQVYFGNLAYGIEAAAHAYFGKSADGLALAECALLAGIIQNANYNDPLAYPERAKDRQAVVLRLMTEAGYISAAEAASAAQDPLQFGGNPFSIAAPHFVMYVWDILQRDYPDLLYTAGLDVQTTLDGDWQGIAERAVTQQLGYLNNPPPYVRVPANANNAALLTMNPRTGEILAMLGSPDYFNAAIDGAVNATLAYRQPGSALKPFTYAVALDPARADYYTAASTFYDVETPFVTRKLESYTPANYAQVEHGLVSLRESLASSFNIPAVVTLDHVGIPDFMQFVSAAGLENLAANTESDLSLTLGGGEVRLLDLVQAYSIFPNGGYRITPQAILRVTRRDTGAVLFDYVPPPLMQRVLDERVAYLITDILSDNDARMAGFGRNSPMNIGRPAAAKTGTTTDFKDNWIVGYTPHIVTGVWVGNADNEAMEQVTGISGAGPIYNLFMRQALEGWPEPEFARPDGLVQVEVCLPSGLLPTPQCPRTRREWFIAGTQPSAYDDLYQTFSVDTRTGYLADDTTPMAYRRAQTYLVLPQELRDWGRRNGIPTPPQGAPILAPDADEPLRLLEPDPYTSFELSSVLPRSAQRLRLTVGAPPDVQAVEYWLNGELLGRSEAAPWALWWELDLGVHELIARATLADGSTLTSAPLPFSVVQDSEALGSFNAPSRP